MTNSKFPIFIEFTRETPTFKKKFEIVERKGLGHPDTMCDLIMDKIETELSGLYLKQTGTIQHHNLDKALLVAGQTENRFGGGSLKKRMKLVLGDRVTHTPKISLPRIKELAVNTANSWFENNLRFVKSKHVQYQFEIGKASQELRSIFSRRKNIGSNDTSALVGYAPYTNTELAVLETEKFLNSKRFKTEFEESGEDIKVMGFRNGDSLDLTIAMAFVDLYVSSERSYFERKKEMIQSIREFHKSHGYFDKLNIIINNLDKKGQGTKGIYLTVLGTSADSSDSGEVGRGNRANQLISLSRPAGSEAIAGKNSISHIGKIYNMLCFKMADEIYKSISGIEEVYVWMYNVIGNPVNKPKAVVIQPLAKGYTLKTLDIKHVIRENLAKMNDFCSSLMTGKAIIA